MNIFKRNSRSNDLTKLPDTELVLLAKDNQEAFGVLYERYVEKIYKYIYYRTGNHHDAEDLASAVFHRAMGHIETYTERGVPFQAWLYRIAYNAFLNQRRIANRSRHPFPDDVAGGEAGPDEQAISREAMQVLARAIGRLPGEFRAALLLRIEEGLSFREIADVLETTEQTARWRVFKARQKLLSVLSPQLDREKP